MQYILDSVIESLFEDSSRRFVYVEQAFFQRWWHEQTSTMQADVRTLVASGQLEFLNGGWCMHDEATTHYIDMIDQTTLGHKFLLDQFGVQPKVGWQIDPFGHSATQAALLSYEVGFESLFFKRVDYQDLAHRQATNTTEFIWQASPSAGAENGIFTGLMYWGYNSPDGFCFDERGHDEPIKDDPTLEGYNLDARVDQYVSEALEQAATIQGTELMVMAGDDFNYGNARMFFKNLDKLMKAVNEDGRLNMFYSTPSIYTEAKNKQQNELGIKYPTKQDDFFPYGTTSEHRGRRGLGDRSHDAPFVTNICYFPLSCVVPSPSSFFSPRFPSLRQLASRVLERFLHESSLLEAHGARSERRAAVAAADRIRGRAQRGRTRSVPEGTRGGAAS